MTIVWFIFAFAMILSGCTARITPANSFVQTPTATLKDIRKIPTPGVAIVATPLSSFPPLSESKPAGSGAIRDSGLIPPFYVHDFMFTNVWYKDTDAGTLRTYVYGGFIPGPGGELSQQGVIVVQVLKMDTRGDIQQVYYQRFPTQTQSGPVRIAGAQGDRLILQSTNGTTFYFDVPSREYVPSLTWVSPIATP
jgi:hypothetical protein